MPTRHLHEKHGDLLQNLAFEYQVFYLFGHGDPVMIYMAPECVSPQTTQGRLTQNISQQNHFGGGECALAYDNPLKASQGNVINPKERNTAK